ncbi:unnamed protein product [Calypogeia fissa]
MGNTPDDVARITAFFESPPADFVAIFDLSHLETKLDAFNLPQPMSVRHLHDRITRFTLDYPELSSLDSVDDVVQCLENQRELDQHRFFEAPHKAAVTEDQNPEILSEQKPERGGAGIHEEQIPGMKEEPDITKDNVKCEEILLPAVKKSTDFQGLKEKDVPENLKGKETGVFLKKKTITGD